MVEQIGSSFIPKKTLVETPKLRRKRGMGLYTLMSLAVFLIAIALAAGVFFYERLLEDSIERKIASLERAQEAFEPALIKELSRLSSRIDSSKTILDSHIALSAFFDHLEKITIQTVRFSELTFTEENGKIVLTMSGEARSFSAVALQSQEFGESDIITNPIFSNLSLDVQGNVTFDFSASIDSLLVSYRNNLPIPLVTTPAGEEEQE